MLETDKWFFDKAFQNRCITLKNGKCFLTILKYILHNPLHHLFLKIHVLSLIKKCHFGIHHPKFREMMTCFAFFGTENRTEIIDFSKGHNSCFAVQLAGLGKIHLMFVIIDAKKLCCIFTTCRLKNGGIKTNKFFFVKELLHCKKDTITNTQNSPRCFSPKI